MVKLLQKCSPASFKREDLVSMLIGILRDLLLKQCLHANSPPALVYKGSAIIVVNNVSESNRDGQGFSSFATKFQTV